MTEAFRILLADPEREGRAGEHFRRHHALHDDRQRAAGGPSLGQFQVPLVVRLEGTEVEEGRRILAESKLDIISATGLTDAAKKVVAAAGGNLKKSNRRIRKFKYADDKLDLI